MTRRGSSGVALAGGIIILFGILMVAGILPNINLNINGLATVSPSAPTNPAYFDHVVIEAMENTPYSAIVVTGTGTTNDPFISSILPYSKILEVNIYSIITTGAFLTAYYI